MHELRLEARFYGLEKEMFPDVAEELVLIKDVSIENASSHHGIHDPSNVLKDDDLYWLSSHQKIKEQWIEFTFPSSKNIRQIGLKVGAFDITPKDFQVQDSNGTVIQSFTAESGLSNDGLQTFQLDNPLETNLIRLFFENRHGSGGGPYMMLNYCEFMTTI